MLSLILAAVTALAPPAFAYDASQPDVRVAATTVAGEARVEDLTFASVRGAGARVHANLVLPAARTGGAVLFVHWLGDDDVTTNLNEFKGDALVLATKGTASLLIDAPWQQKDWFDKIRSPQTDYADSIDVVKNLRRALDVLIARGGADPAKVAFVGHDFGAMYGAILSGVDPRPQYYAFMAGTTTLSEWFLLGAKPADQAAYVAQMAPLDPVLYLPLGKARGYLVQFANHDAYIPSAKARAFAGAVPEPKMVTYYDVDHSMRLPAATSDRLTWLETRVAP